MKILHRKSFAVKRSIIDEISKQKAPTRKFTVRDLAAQMLAPLAISRPLLVLLLIVFEKAAADNNSN